jgi:phosphate/sulfate permease
MRQIVLAWLITMPITALLAAGGLGLWRWLT